MNKQELIGHVADRSGLSRNDASRAVETMLEVITSTLKRGDEVRLVGFGTFSVTRRKASSGRNPRTGEPMQIDASSQPKFRRARSSRTRSSSWTGAAAALYPPLPRSSPARRARSSVVEHTLHTGGVVGSNPTAPTMRRSRKRIRRVRRCLGRVGYTSRYAGWKLATRRISFQSVNSMSRPLRRISPCRSMSASTRFTLTEVCPVMSAICCWVKGLAMPLIAAVHASRRFAQEVGDASRRIAPTAIDQPFVADRLIALQQSPEKSAHFRVGVQQRLEILRLADPDLASDDRLDSVMAQPAARKYALAGKPQCDDLPTP